MQTFTKEVFETYDKPSAKPLLIVSLTHFRSQSGEKFKN